MRSYQEIISSLLHGRQYDPRHIEAYMRLEYSTLDGLSKDRFSNEVEICLLCIDHSGIENAEALALSFNL